jgi:pimeloyl-ACP methyl ester carboxylesterase
VGDGDAKKEGIVFVHGFGASGSQWSKAIKSLSKYLPKELIGNETYEVVAPDLLGFGESEKPQLSYTQYLWESYVSSFVKEISVREKRWDAYIIGGNSIGGYTAMGVAADDTVPISDAIAGVNAVSASGAPGTSRCTGLVLMNSAGRILNREEVEKTTGLDALVTVGAETAGDDLPKCR